MDWKWIWTRQRTWGFQRTMPMCQIESKKDNG
jgi:hypothetical protein